MSRRRRLAAAGAGVLALAGAAWLATSTVVLRADSDSMAPAVDPGDIVVAAVGGGAPARGDLVLFADPGGWGERVARHSGRIDEPSVFVKRVVGLPGETVACCDAEGRVRVDGAPLAEPYLMDAGGLASVLAFRIVVPADAVFVLGDNRAASLDSRYLGAVPLDSLTGVVRAVVPLG